MKEGPRSRRIAERDALAQREADTQQFVRSKMKPELVANGKKAMANFRSESFGSFTREKS